MRLPPIFFSNKKCMVKDLGNMQMQQLVDTGEYLLVPVRGFYYAYGSGAFALSRVMSYRVVRRRSENGEVLTCGFPDTMLAQVLHRLNRAGAEVEMMGDQVFLFRGLDGTVDDDMVWDSEDPEEIDGAIADGEPAVNAAVDWLADAVMGFDTEEATANDAMLFLKSVQGHLRRIHKKVLKKKK